MYCKQCGYDLGMNPDVGSKCPSCSTAVGKGGRFCSDCGKKLQPGGHCDCQKQKAPVPEVKPETKVPVEEHKDTWLCPCGNMASGKFCSECGMKKVDLEKAKAEPGPVEVPAKPKEPDRPVAKDHQKETKVPEKKKVQPTVKEPVVERPSDDGPQFKNPIFAKIAAGEKKQSRVLQEEAVRMALGISLEEMEEKVEEQVLKELPKEEDLPRNIGKANQQKADFVASAQEVAQEIKDEKVKEPEEEEVLQSPAAALFPESLSKEALRPTEKEVEPIQSGRIAKTKPDKKNNRMFESLSLVLAILFGFCLLIGMSWIVTAAVGFLTLAFAILNEIMQKDKYGVGIMLVLVFELFAFLLNRLMP